MRLPILCTVYVLFLAGSVSAVEADVLTEMQARVTDLKNQLKEAKSKLNAETERVQEIEKLLQTAETARSSELIKRARTGNETAISEVLDQFDESGNFVEYIWAAPFAPAADAAGAAANGEVFLRILDKKWQSAKDVQKAKLSWLLGVQRSMQAGEFLRAALIAPNQGPDVVANALAALRKCPRKPQDRDLVARFADDKREVKIKLGFYQPGQPQMQTVAAYAADYLRDFNTEKLATVPGEIVVEAPTLICLGFEWLIEGDSNLNCTVNVAYRKKGADVWKKGFPFLRCDPRPNPVYGLAPGNLLAGSIFDLEPDTEYEVKLALNDPDGGTDERVVSARTRAEPRPAADGRIRHVAPGDGGGSGTETDPFLGLVAADSAAQPGDIFLLRQGSYTGGITLKNSGAPGKPIVYRGVNAEQTVVDIALAKQKTDDALNISKCKFLHFEKIGVKGGTTAVKAGATEEIVFRRCRLTDYKEVGIWGLPLSLVRGGPLVQCRNWYFADNTLIGPASWVKGRKFDSYAIMVCGEGHVFCYNRSESNYDDIALTGSKDPALRTKSNDIYGNDLSDATDDGIQADYTYHNTRIFRNRLYNTFSTISIQPIFGGPGYILHNAMYNTTNKPFKLHVDPSGIIIAHNTCVAAVEAFYGGNFQHALFRNNLLLGSGSERGGYWLMTLADRMDMDYSGYHVNDPKRFIKFNNVAYSDMRSFAEGTGTGSHNVQVDYSIFTNFIPPPGPGKWAETSKIDLTLRAGCAAIDAGVILPGINDHFAGKAPDLGCYEQGAPMPHYGPRPE